MKIKICGITEKITALAAVSYGANAIGFVFAPSKRRISIEKALEICSVLPNETMKVGVFVNENIDEINKIANYVGLTHVQLHGDETPEYCSKLKLPVIKGISINDEKDLKQIDNYDCNYILIDGPKEKFYGGNGIPFNWDLIEGHHSNEKKLIIAGGLNKNNVTVALLKTKPHMVDVSSGVETNGIKDISKIKEFISIVKGISNENIQFTE